MWTAILGVLGRGAFALLERWGLVGGAYLKGRADAAAADRLATAERAAADAQEQRRVQEDLRRLAPDARRDRLRRWERKP